MIVINGLHPTLHRLLFNTCELAEELTALRKEQRKSIGPERHMHFRVA